MDDAKLMKLSPAQFSIVEKIAKEAERQGVNPALAIAIAEAETGGSFTHYRGDKVLTSPAGAKGVMQIMPDTARLYNKKYGIEINPDDEDSNIMGGVTILKDLLTTYKSRMKQTQTKPSCLCLKRLTTILCACLKISILMTTKKLV